MMYTREDTIRSDRGSELGHKTVGIQDQWVYMSCHNGLGGDRSDTDHSKCLLLGGRRLNLLTVIPKPKGSGGARAATAQIGPANERNKTK